MLIIALSPAAIIPGVMTGIADLLLDVSFMIVVVLRGYWLCFLPLAVPCLLACLHREPGVNVIIGRLGTQHPSLSLLMPLSFSHHAYSSSCILIPLCVSVFGSLKRCSCMSYVSACRGTLQVGLSYLWVAPLLPNYATQRRQSVPTC